MLVIVPTVCNVKISFRTKLSSNITTWLIGISTKWTDSYIIIKYENFTYTIHNNRYNEDVINVTGISKFEDILAAIRSFQNLIRKGAEIAPTLLPDEKCYQVKIDNSTAFGRYLEVLDFTQLPKCISDKQSFKFNPTLFPGCFIKLSNGKNVLVFRSGKYNIVGCKSRKELREVFLELKQIFLKYNEHMQASRAIHC